MDIVKARTMPGVMELLPGDQIAYNRVRDTIRATFERFGFLPIETPVMELVSVLLTKSGGETEKQVYFTQSTGARAQGKDPDLALRFDLTVPLARYVAEHEPDLAFPFRRYQMQRVYRGERAQKGRYREFEQCDIDVIGRNDLDLRFDAEIPAVIDQLFTQLDFGPFTIHMNHRKILRGLFAALGIEAGERQTTVLREVDKLDKRGRDAVLATLSEDEYGLGGPLADKLLTILNTRGPGAEVLATLRGLDVSHALLDEGIAEMAVVVEALKALGVPADHWCLNLSIARGLDYYTGTVYETLLDDHPELGSICSGGRYENLAGHYTKSKLPGVGISIGLTRLFSKMQELEIVSSSDSTVQCLVARMDPELDHETIALGAELRAAGINTQVVFDGGKLGKQMKAADKAGIPFVAILGPDELTRGSVQVKNLRSGEQQDIPRAEVGARLLAQLGETS